MRARSKRCGLKDDNLNQTIHQECQLNREGVGALSGIMLVFVLVVAAILGYRVIAEVPSLLHTPLMSGMNALSGITVVGALAAAGAALAWNHRFLALLAVTLAAVNVVGGFVVTDRMLKMFRSGRGES